MASFSFRKLDTLQRLGLVILALGLVLMAMSFSAKCPPEDLDEACDSSYSWHIFDAGVICVLLFLCVPQFSLVPAQPFYDQFPWLKGRIGPRSMRKPAGGSGGTYAAHAASVV
jgi:hypothetical protein